MFLILGNPSEYDDIVKYDITATVCSIDAAMKLTAQQSGRIRRQKSTLNSQGRIGYAGTDADTDEVAAINNWKY